MLDEGEGVGRRATKARFQKAFMKFHMLISDLSNMASLDDY